MVKCEWVSEWVTWLQTVLSSDATSQAVLPIPITSTLLPLKPSSFLNIVSSAQYTAMIGCSSIMQLIFTLGSTNIKYRLPLYLDTISENDKQQHFGSKMLKVWQAIIIIRFCCKCSTSSVIKMSKTMGKVMDNFWMVTVLLYRGEIGCQYTEWWLCLPEGQAVNGCSFDLIVKFSPWSWPRPWGSSPC